MADNSSSERGDYLRSRFQDLQERLHRLKIFDKPTEIHTYCDDLECQVIEKVESIIKDVNAFQRDLLAEINSYRDRLLGPCESHSTSSDQEAQHGIERSLEALAADIEAFGTATVSVDLYQQSLDLEAFDQHRNRADELNKKAKEIRRMQREQAFRGDFMKFNDASFDRSCSKLVGKLDLFGMDIEDETRIRHLDLEKKVPKIAYKFEKPIHGLAMLSDGNLAVSLHCQPIFIWNPETQSKLFELIATSRMEFKGLERICYSRNGMIQLPNGHLAVVHERACVDIWNLTTRDLHKCIINKDLRYETPHVLPNGNLVVLCGQEILVLNPHKDYKRDVVLKMKVNFVGMARLKILSDGNLAMVDSNNFWVWNPQTGHMIKQGDLEVDGTGIEKIRPCEIFYFGEVAFCFQDKREVDMYSLRTGKLSRVFQSQGDKLVEHPDGFLLSIRPGITRMKSQPDNAAIIVPPYIESVHLSSDGKFMVTCYHNGVILLWSLAGLLTS